jgi:hypothetical protein
LRAATAIVAHATTELDSNLHIERRNNPVRADSRTRDSISSYRYARGKKAGTSYERRRDTVTPVDAMRIRL